MADEKLTDPLMPTLAASHRDDLLYTVDVHDTTDDPAGTSKSLTPANLFKALQAGDIPDVSATYTKAAVVPNTAPSAGQVLVGNAGGTAYAPVALSGVNCTLALASTGALTVTDVATAAIASNAVTNAKMATGTANSLAGYDGSGNFSDVAIGTGLSLSGGTLTASGGGGGGTVTSITAGTGLSGGTITTSGTISLSTPVSVAHGGTGDATLTAHSVLLGEGTGNVAFATTGTAGQVLIDQGSGADPAFEPVSGSGATVTMSSAGVITISAIANASLAHSSVTVNSAGGITGGGAVSLGSSITLSGLVPTSQTTTYTASAGDLVLADASGGAWNLTLPSASAAGAGARVAVAKVDTGGNAVTVTRAGSDTIKGAGIKSGGDTTRPVVGEGDLYEFTSDGTATWEVTRREIAASYTSARASSAQVIASSSATVVTLGTVISDADSQYASNKITVKRAGKYQITSAMLWQPPTGGAARGENSIRLNGSTYIGYQDSFSSTYAALTVSVPYVLAAGDYLELVAFQASGGNVSTYDDSVTHSTLTVQRIGD